MDLSEAIVLATQAHDGQVDKSGEPYVLHPLRVMLAVPEDCRIAAVLHDVAEDTAYDMDALQRRGLNGRDLHAVGLLTRDEGGHCTLCRGTGNLMENICPVCKGKGRPTYREYIDHIVKAPQAAGRIARTVKIEDIEDNLRPERGWADQAGLAQARYYPALELLKTANALHALER